MEAVESGVISIADPRPVEIACDLAAGRLTVNDERGIIDSPFAVLYGGTSLRTQSPQRHGKINAFDFMVEPVLPLRIE